MKVINRAGIQNSGVRVETTFISYFTIFIYWEIILDKSQQGYNHIEMGRAELKIDDLIRLCRFYDLSADYLIGLTDKPLSYKTWERE